MEEVQALVRISGRVQGVYFRAYTRDMARPLGLKGYVRNLPGGKVEAVFVGPKDKVDQAISWCHQGSPLGLGGQGRGELGRARRRFYRF